MTDQSSLDGTVAAPDAIANPADVDAALGSAVQSLSGSAGSPDPGLAESIGGEAGCVIGSTGVTGNGSVGGGGGAQNAVPWLNGRTGALPDLTGPTSAVSTVTGPTSANRTVERFNIVGTDLGIMWNDGTGGTMIAFGDTVGAADDPVCNGLLGNWRSNVVLHSDDTALSDGMDIAGAAMAAPNRAKEAVPSLKQPGVEQTTIPTAGIAVPHEGAANGHRQYMDFMSVRSWGEPGSWETNYSALAYSDDGGRTWHAPTFTSVTDPADGAAPASVRPNLGANANFQMGAFVRDHTEDPDDPGSYVYLFGTPSGRDGPARLSRVRQQDIADVSAYRYWDGDGWTADPAAAAVVLDGRVGELSVDYNAYLDRYIAMYSSGDGGLVVRTAHDLVGPWSAPTTLVSSEQAPTLYGGFMHPASNASGDSELYFLATTWSDYNVMLMRTDLSVLRD